MSQGDDAVYEDDDLFAELSSKELRILNVVTVVSSLFSIVGSSLILTWVIKERRSGGVLTSHRRFLFGMSTCDIVASFFRYTLLPWTGSDEPSPSCSFQGAMVMLTMIAPCYNVSLSFFYVSVIRYNMQPQVFATKYESYLHVMSLGVPILLMIILLIFQGFNPSGSIPNCSLSVYPPGCDAKNSMVECERGQLGAAILFYAYTPAFCLVLVALLVNNLLIFCHVRKLEERSWRWRQSSSLRFHNSNNNSQWAATMTTAASPRNASTTAAERQERQEAFRKTRLVATQSFCYVGAFFLCNLWPLAGSTIYQIDPTGLRRGEYFGWLLGLHMCMPAQGFLNAMVYLREKRATATQRGSSLPLFARTATEPSSSASSAPNRTLRCHPNVTVYCCGCVGFGGKQEVFDSSGQQQQQTSQIQQLEQHHEGISHGTANDEGTSMATDSQPC